MIIALFRMPYNSLTLFKYLYIGIDGSIFYLYYLYCLSIFQRTWRFVSKAGAKVSGLFLTAKLFSKFFFRFFFQVCFSGSLCERERSTRQENRQNRGTCESDCKDKDFYFHPPNFFGSFFCSYPLSASALYNRKSLHQGSPLLESGCKSRGFSVTNQIYHALFFIYFWRIMLKR